jgi:hypothetical protein
MQTVKGLDQEDKWLFRFYYGLSIKVKPLYIGCQLKNKEKRRFQLRPYHPAH